MCLFLSDVGFTDARKVLRSDLFGHCHRIVCVGCRNSLNLLYCFFQEQVISFAVFTEAQRLNLSRHCASFRHIGLGNCQAPIEIMQCWLNTCPKQCIIPTFGHWCWQMWKIFRKLSHISVVLLEKLSFSGAINPSALSRNLHTMSMNMQSGVHALGGRWSVGRMLWSLVVSSSMCCRFFRPFARGVPFPSLKPLYELPLCPPLLPGVFLEWHP